MKNCMNCGLAVDDNINICPQCGSLFSDGESKENPDKNKNKWSFSEDLNPKDLKPFKSYNQENTKESEETKKEPVKYEELSENKEEIKNNDKNEEPAAGEKVEHENKELDITNNEVKEHEVKTNTSRKPMNARSVLLGFTEPTQSKFDDDEAEQFYSDEDVIVGDIEDVEAIERKEKERQAFLSKPNRLRDALFSNKEEPEEEETTKPISIATKGGRSSIFNNMFSGFADEAEDEAIKAEIQKSKQNLVNEDLASILESGSEGRVKKVNNNQLNAKETRADVITQKDYNEKDYDNYYEFVIPSDNMKYEAKSSFKVHFIAVILVIITSIVVGVVFSRTALSQIL